LLGEGNMKRDEVGRREQSIQVDHLTADLLEHTGAHLGDIISQDFHVEDASQFGDPPAYPPQAYDTQYAPRDLDTHQVFLFPSTRAGGGIGSWESPRHS